MSNKPIVGDQVITGDLYLGGVFINAADQHNTPFTGTTTFERADPEILVVKEKTPINAIASEGKLTSSGTLVPATHATSILLSGGANASEGKIVTIGSTVYRFKGTTLAAYDVHIGSDAAETLDFLKDAINATGTGNGSDYHEGTLAHPDVVATTNSNTEQTIQAKVPGVDANAIVTTDDDSDLSWGDVTLGGGGGDSTPGVTDAAATLQINGREYMFVDALSETAPDAEGVTWAIIDQILYGGSESVALDNFKLAIDKGSTEGTNYSTGTVVNADVSGGTNTSTTQVLTAKVKGVIGDLITITEDLANTVFDDGTLGTETPGVDGTVGVANETCVDATYLYHAIAANTIADANWRRLTLGSAY